MLINTNSSKRDLGPDFDWSDDHSHGLSEAPSLPAAYDHGMLGDGLDRPSTNGFWDWWIGLIEGSDLAKEARAIATSIETYLSKLPERIGHAVKNWVEALVANAKALGHDILKGMEKIARGFGKLASGDVLGGYDDITGGLSDIAGAPLAAIARLTLDTVSAVQTTLGLEPIGRGLTDAEIAHLRPIFGDSIDYARVVVKEGAAGIFAGDRAITMGNTIYMKNSTDFGTLAHEMTHVWQFQNGGNEYMAKAGWAQLQNQLHGNDSHVAYDWTLGIDQGWAKLNPEQQAQLIQDAQNSGYLDQRAAWQPKWSEYAAKEAAYQRKYPPLTLLGPHKKPGNLAEVPIPPKRSPAVEAQRIKDRAALDAERAALLASRPVFEFRGVPRTREIEDALTQIQNGDGAP